MTRQRAEYPLDHSKTNDAKDGLHDLANKASDQLKDAAERAQDMAGRVTEQVREYGERAQGVVNEVKPFVEKSLRDQPMTTLAGAAVLGFVLGALWKK